MNSRLVGATKYDCISKASFLFRSRKGLVPFVLASNLECSGGWLEFLLLLILPPECWDYRV